MNKFELRTFPHPDELAQAAAEAWLNEVDLAQRDERSYSVALSGGRITQKLFAAAVAQAQHRHSSWENIHFFWADERCLPPTDSESNFRLAQELLFAPLKIRADQIHRIRGEDTPEAAAQAAQLEIGRLLPRNEAGQPMLDLIFLGLGEDGHTASLFPGEPKDLSRSPAVYRAVLNSPKPPPHRVTLGFPAIAAAKQVWMLASGKGKETAFQDSLSPEGKTPFARVLRLRSHTKIFSDIPANSAS